MNGFGIDFGTTNSVAAVCDDRTNKVLAFTDRGMPHPSVVQYRPDELIVGRKAKHQIHGWANVAGNAFVSSVKRKLGTNHVYSILGERKAAWEVAADIFRFLKSEALEDYGHDLCRSSRHSSGLLRRASTR